MYEDEAAQAYEPEAKRETSEVSNRVTALQSAESALAREISELEERLISVLRDDDSKEMLAVPREAFSTTLAQALDMVAISLEGSDQRLRSILRRLEI